MKKIDLCNNPDQFFQERIALAKARQKVASSADAEFYLVELMTRFMFSSNLYNGENNNLEPLAILYLKGQDPKIDQSDRFKTLKKLGDTSLYIAGFFGDSLQKKVVDLDYYRSMGSGAYRSISDTVKDMTFKALYNELYTKFTAFVDILTEVSQEILVHENQSVLRLYEIYVRTGNEKVRQQLVEKGVSMGALTPSKSGKVS